jgi:hypothetical protein
MSPEVVVIMPETSFTRAHSILTDTSRMDCVTCQSITTPPCVCVPTWQLCFKSKLPSR